MGKTALELITEERTRQTSEEGYTSDHDDEHVQGELALLAAAYILSSCGEPKLAQQMMTISLLKGWTFKPKDPITDLVKAGALIRAELERRLRKEGT